MEFVIGVFTFYNVDMRFITDLNTYKHKQWPYKITDN